MRVRTFLRQIREGQGLTITQVCEATGIPRGDVSMIERGHTFPHDEQAARMLSVYGPRDEWYPRGVLGIVDADIRDCPGCGDELDPDASRRRIYHSDSCRNEARRRA